VTQKDKIRLDAGKLCEERVTAALEAFILTTGMVPYYVNHQTDISASGKVRIRDVQVYCSHPISGERFRRGPQ
jgi:hypothetical protein